MRQHVEPTIGTWYDSKDFPECFKVVALDSKHDAVEIQYFDGEIEEIDHDTWLAFHPHEISEPEDGSAPYEMEHEDILGMLNEIDNEYEYTKHINYLDDVDESDWR